MRCAAAQCGPNPQVVRMVAVKVIEGATESWSRSSHDDAGELGRIESHVQVLSGVDADVVAIEGFPYGTTQLVNPWYRKRTNRERQEEHQQDAIADARTQCAASLPFPCPLPVGHQPHGPGQRSAAILMLSSGVRQLP